MKINITNKQYKQLIEMCAIANSVVGILGDALPDTDYKEKSNEMEKLEEYFLQYASDFGCDDWVDQFQGKNVFDDKVYEEKISTIISDYDENIMFDSLANELAKRDFRRDHSKEEIEKMAEESGGYLGVAMYDYEKRYWDEFEKYGVGRLEVEE